MSAALIEYVRKPNKIQKERTTVLYEDRIVGEKGDELALDDIERIQYKRRFDGAHKLVLHGHGTTIICQSHTVAAGKAVQNQSIIKDLYNEITARVSDDCQLIEGSNLQFYTGLLLFAGGVIGSGLVAYHFFTEHDLPSRALSIPVLAIIGAIMAAKGRAKLVPNRRRGQRNHRGRQSRGRH